MSAECVLSQQCVNRVFIILMQGANVFSSKVRIFSQPSATPFLVFEALHEETKANLATIPIASLTHILLGKQVTLELTMRL